MSAKGVFFEKPLVKKISLWYSIITAGKRVPIHDLRYTEHFPLTAQAVLTRI